jgi:hypothetical protein
MTPRITPYTAGGSIAERIDEILIEQPSVVHIEHMSGVAAYMLIGERRFWIEARSSGQLVIREES